VQAGNLVKKESIMLSFNDYFWIAIAVAVGNMIAIASRDWRIAKLWKRGIPTHWVVTSDGAHFGYPPARAYEDKAGGHDEKGR